jgi:hypothetical protein
MNHHLEFVVNKIYSFHIKVSIFIVLFNMNKILNLGLIN